MQKAVKLEINQLIHSFHYHFDKLYTTNVFATNWSEGY